MFTKLAVLVHSKVALAVLGAVFVAGGGTAIAVAAHAANSSNNANTSHHAASHTPEAGANSHAHTEAIIGVLKAYNASGHTISVLAEDATTPTTITVNADTKVDGEHASTLADLANAIGSKVQVQADKQSNGTLVAWKITVTGDNEQHGDGDGSGQSGQHQVDGTINSIGTTSFVVKQDDGTLVTVTISSATHFMGTIHARADLKVGMHVTIQGSQQSGGTFAATQIEAQGH